MGKIFFTSDLHFGHRAIVHFVNSDLKTLEAREKKIIENWNKKVGVNDTVYILGDLRMNKCSCVDKLVALNGKKILVLGNHDFLKPEEKKYFEEIVNYKELKINNELFVLFHYPIKDWNKKIHGSYHLYGHLHNTSTCKLLGDNNSLCVNTEFHDYTPVELSEVKEKIHFIKNKQNKQQLLLNYKKEIRSVVDEDLFI